MPAQVQAPAAGVRRYTKWRDVPEGLFTRTQLRQLTPSRQPLDGAHPAGQVLYGGNNYAPLFRLDDTVERKTGSPAQVAAAARARELQRVCRWCGYTDEDAPLGRGRLCPDCRAVVRAYREHLAAVTHVPVCRQIRSGEPVRGVAIAARLATGPVGQRLPVHLAVVALADLQVLLDTSADPWATTGPCAYPAVVARLAEVTARHSYPRHGGGRACLDVVVWGMLPLERLIHPAVPPDQPGQLYAGLEDHPWVWGHTSLQSRFADWYHQPGSRGQNGRLWPVMDVGLPGAGAEPVDQAIALAILTRQLADGTAPVHPAAPWLAAHVPADDLAAIARRWAQ